MIVKVDGVKELILVSIGIIGEVEESWIKERLESSYSDRFVKKAINELVKDKLIKRTADKYLRFKKPGGLEWLKEKSSLLYFNYEVMTNNHNFSGGFTRKIRQEQTVKLLEHILCRDVPVNHIEIKFTTSLGKKPKKEDSNIMDVLGMVTELSREYRSAFDKAGEIKTLNELLQYIEPGERVFFTSKIIKKEKHNAINQTTNRTNISRMFGVYISGSNFYPVYYVGCKTIWKPRVENQTNVILQDAWRGKEEVKGKEGEYQNSMKGSSIFYYEENDVLSNITKEFDKRNRESIRPWEVYDHAYYIPISDNVIEDIISVENFKERLGEAVFGENLKTGSFYDAMIDENLAWELLTNDVVKIRKIKQIEPKIIEEGGELILVVYPWQEEILRNTFNNPKLIVLNDEEINFIVKKLKEETKC